MKLRNKLVIAQLCVFLVIMGILLMALPELVYRNISVKDREDTMILNEQIMSQLDQNFEELVRFTKIVAEEPELPMLLPAKMLPRNTKHGTGK